MMTDLIPPAAAERALVVAASCRFEHEERLARAAVWYARQGFRVLPVAGVVIDGELRDRWRCTCERGASCDKPGKHPLVRRGSYDATSDEKQICAWWRRWPQANIGLAPREGQVVLDVDDDGHLKTGSLTLETLEARHGRLPPTWTARSGAGGMHLWLAAPDGFRNRVNFAPWLDLRTVGGYVVAPPSRHRSGRLYEWLPEAWPHHLSLAAMPGWLEAIARRPPPPPPPPPPVLVPRAAGSRPDRIERALAYLERCEPAVAGENGHKRAFSVIARVVLGFALSDEEALSVLSAWNSRCSPPWSVDELRHKVRSARSHDKRHQLGGLLNA